jgi:hypothetical protein
MPRGSPPSQPRREPGAGHLVASCAAPPGCRSAWYRSGTSRRPYPGRRGTRLPQPCPAAPPGTRLKVDLTADLDGGTGQPGTDTREHVHNPKGRNRGGCSNPGNSQSQRIQAILRNAGPGRSPPAGSGRAGRTWPAGVAIRQGTDVHPGRTQASALVSSPRRPRPPEQAGRSPGAAGAAPLAPRSPTAARFERTRPAPESEA